MARLKSSWPALVGRAAGLAVLFVLYGCSGARLPDLSSLPDRPDSFPEAGFLSSDAEAVLIDPDRSWLHIRVYREGKLARLGHNHIVSAPVHGIARALDGKLDLRAWVAVADLVVDDPALRAAQGEGFESEPSADDVAGTRANMLGEKALHAEAHPFLLATVELDGCNRSARFRIRDQWREVSVDDWRIDGNTGRMRLQLLQSDFGMEPFSVLGGALRVADGLDVTVQAALEEDPRLGACREHDNAAE